MTRPIRSALIDKVTIRAPKIFSQHRKRRQRIHKQSFLLSMVINRMTVIKQRLEKNGLTMSRQLLKKRRRSSQSPLFWKKHQKPVLYEYSFLDQSKSRKEEENYLNMTLFWKVHKRANWKKH